MLEDEIRKAVAEMLAAGDKPSVRSVREAVGRGSHTDIGDVLRRIQEEQHRLKFALKELPGVLQSQATVLAGDLWKSAQEIANRLADDVRHGCEIRVAEATAQAQEMTVVVDRAEATISDLKARLEKSEADHARVTAEAEESRLKVISLEAEYRSLNQLADRREQELERTFSALNAAAKVMGVAKVDAEPPPASGVEEMVDDGDESATDTPATFENQASGGDLADAVVEVMKAGDKPLSCAAIQLLLPNDLQVTHRQLYNLLYRRVGTTFKKAGNGHFALAD